MNAEGEEYWSNGMKFEISLKVFGVALALSGWSCIAV